MRPRLSTWKIFAWSAPRRVVIAMTIGMMGSIGCGDDAPTSTDDGGIVYADGDVPLRAVLRRASKSSTIAISDDDAIVVMVSPEDGSIGSFTTEDNNRLARLETGAEPSAVVLHPDGTTAFVANRADATVVKIEGIDTNAPRIVGTAEVGSEPTGLALSPTGGTLFVAEHAEGRVAVLETESMTEVGAIDAVQNPFGLAVTNDGDTEDDDELLLVPELFGEPTEAGEGTDASRRARIRIYRVSDLEPTTPIVFEPVDSGFGPEGGPTAMTSPNQLSTVAIQNGKVYVPSVSVSPGAPVRFNLNIQPVVYVADLEGRSPDDGPLGTINLARAVKDEAGDAPAFFLADIVDLSFIGDSGIAYVVSRGADVVQRVVFERAATTIGSDRNLQIDVGSPPPGAEAGCQTPTGITTAHGAPRAYLSCWVNRRLGVVDLSTQSLLTTVEASNPPTGEAIEVSRGRRFFFTGRGRWSDNAWSSCASCHPGGLTDNVTWSFAAGPRQSTSLDGSFSHGPGMQQQRVFNWTAIFDEVHDFERNTRGVQGGLGAITIAAEGGACGAAGQETRDPLDLGGGLGVPLKELQDRPESCTQDWDAIDAWMRTIRPSRARRFVDAESVARGAALFGMPDAGANNGGCVACHGGAGWTVSRRFFTPSSATNARLAAEPFTAPVAWPPGWNEHTLQIAAQPASSDPTNEPSAPPQVACVIRDVGTFGVPGDDDATSSLEVRDSGARAQGAGGYNVPSLYGLTVGAPYLHHGGASTLEALFDDARWQSHTRAANPVFLTTGDVEQQKADLIAFLRSIDASTPEQAIPSGFDGCP